MMSKNPMDEFDLLRSLGAELPEGEEGARSRAWAALKARIDQATVQRPSQARRPRTRSRRVWLAAAVVLAAAFGLLLPLLPLGGPSGPSAAAATLDRLAEVAARQQAVHLGPDEFVYTRSQTTGIAQGEDVSTGQRWSFLVSAMREAWIGSDGSGRIREIFEEPRFASEDDRAAWIAAGSPDLLPERVSDELYGPGELVFVDLSALPTDTEALRRLIEERRVLEGPPGARETFDIIGDLLRETYGPPEIRAALFRVAASLPGVEFLGTVRDALGRPGVAVGFSDQGLRSELVIDPETSLLLEERVVPVPFPPSLPAVPLSRTVYVESAVVDSTSARP